MDSSSRAWRSLEVQFIQKRAHPSLLTSSVYLTGFTSSFFLFFCSWSLQQQFLPSLYIFAWISSELCEPCGCDVWRSSVLKLLADFYCREHQQPPLFPPSFTPSSCLKFVLPHSQSGFAQSSTFFFLHINNLWAIQ